ncbi:MAG: chorismate mutase [Acidimicrobiia bacterium]|nr:chorismate mutase [Acidimicrobiia bacterium]
MPQAVRALRGATTIDEDTPEQIHARVGALVGELFRANDVAPEDVISILFSATGDIHSAWPAAAARDQFDLADVPLMHALELDIVGALPRCIRVMMTLRTERAPRELHHVYQEGAVVLRPDLRSR